MKGMHHHPATTTATTTATAIIVVNVVPDPPPPPYPPSSYWWQRALLPATVISSSTIRRRSTWTLHWESEERCHDYCPPVGQTFSCSLPPRSCHCHLRLHLGTNVAVSASPVPADDTVRTLSVVIVCIPIGGDDNDIDDGVFPTTPIVGLR